MYYLNVMAGPGTEREWLISDDPQHGWVRELWKTEQIDPRLPSETMATFGMRRVTVDGGRSVGDEWKTFGMGEVMTTGCGGEP